MQGTIGIAASDVEPGTVIVTVTANSGDQFVIPLRDHDLQRFATAYAVAMMTAFTDIALTELNAREPEHRR